ncbi:PAS domain S-box protein [Sphingomonas sp.]|jgi:PAS domain S-box-containing protein|uniref:PAS domain S-box protein n=1 Tax=Sphingomonas sp. TaxID=28214 RepID=UPI002DEDEC0E|nr:PAS domain S-box protein [Sphingomonas sp.]
MPTSHLHLDASLPVPKPAPTDGAYVLDRSWRIVDINDHALDHLGVSRSEAIGATLWKLAPALVGTNCETHYREAMENRNVEEFVGPSAAHQGRWLEVRVFPVSEGLAVHLRDITKRVQLEAKLRDRERLLSAIFSQAGAGFAQVDLEGRFELVNDAYCAITGYSRQQLLGRRMQDITHPDDLARNLELLNEALTSTNSFTIEKRYVRPDGSAVWVNNSVTILRNDAGAPIGILAVTTDRTEARRSEQQLRESEQRFRQMADAVPQIVWITDADGKNEFFNRQWFDYTGVAYQPTTAAKVAADQVHPEDGPATIAAFDEARRTGTTFHVEHRIRSRTGEYRWFLVRGEPYRDPDTGEIVRWFGASVDIHDRKVAEAALRENEARLRALTDNLPAGMVYQVSTGRDGSARQFRYVSGSHKRLTGVPAEAVLADPSIPYQLIHPDDRSMLAEAEEEAIRARSSFDLQVRFRRADGELRWARIISAPREQPDGSLIWDGIQIDTTDQKLAEAALRASEERLRELNGNLEAQVAERTADRDRMWRLSTDIMLVARFDGTINSVNPAWTSILGWTDTALVGSNFMNLVHADDQEATLAEMGKLGAGETTCRFENRYRTADGDYRWISWTAVPGDELIHAVGRDVTAEKARQAELESAQEALRQSQKMEAMGSLTGGVAHDFNNLLTPIIGSLDMLVRKGVGSERERRLIDGALQSAERAKTLVQRLLAFARRQPLQATAVDTARVVEGMAGLIDSTVGPTIDVRVEVGADLPPAKADLNQLEMALLNLAVNARDAMPNGGELVMAVNSASVLANDPSGLKPGTYVRLSVSDTGIGMDEATQRRAVEPFFSTKGIGKGTGLGLSMVHGLAAQLGGGLTIESVPGEGTTISLFLPISAGPLGADEDAPAAVDGPIGRGTALLVDDEDLVRMSTADMLSDLGFEVVEAGSAEDALRFLQTSRKPDLLVTDHLMPGMSGAELPQNARALHPALPILVVSGYAEVEGISPDLPRLTKPFRNADLVASLSALLPQET